MLHPTSVTNIIDRLERQGLVSRIAHPTDRRTTLAAITDEGRRVVAKATEAVIATGFGMQALSDAELDQITAMLRKMRIARRRLPRLSEGQSLRRLHGRAGRGPRRSGYATARRTGRGPRPARRGCRPRPPGRSPGRGCARRGGPSTGGGRSRSRSGPRATSSSDRWMAASVSLSTDEVASSSTRIGGSLRMARAIDSRWRWPPDSFWPALADHRVVALGQVADELVRLGQPGGLLQLRVAWRRGGRRPGSPARSPGTGTRPGRRSRSPGAARPAARRRPSTPSMVMRPPVASYSRSSSLTTVDLPAPVAPTMAWVSPAGTTRSNPPAPACRRRSPARRRTARPRTARRPAPAAAGRRARRRWSARRPAGRGCAGSRPSPAGRGRTSRPGG